ncbi:hypothetical protein C8Q77DRAFT_263180 [Trametes polyzona]|nr:hypothetical protein C8Q77DRAFT_263180 [Trametes polyzona]
MPRDLPGMFWDEEKGRYFPLSSRPAGPGSSMATSTRPSPPKAAETQSTHPRKKMRVTRELDGPPLGNDNGLGYLSRSTNMWHNFQILRETPLSGRHRLAMHDLQASYVSSRFRQAISTNRRNDTGYPLNWKATALCRRTDFPTDSRVWAGGYAGGLYSIDTKDPDINYRELSLSTHVTSVTRSGALTLVTTFGSPPTIAVSDRSVRMENNDDPLSTWLVRQFPLKTCSDVRCGHVYDHSIAVGGARSAIYFVDAEDPRYVRLPSKSDILSIWLQDRNLVHIGMRNGVVERYDLRGAKSGPDIIVNMSEKERQLGGAPVQHVRTIHQHGLLVETMRGDLEVHDLRFLRNSTPLLQFDGHVSSYEDRIGLTVDPGENFLFAGGGDCCLRTWSLRTGRPLYEEATHGHPLVQSPSEPIFDVPISAMELVQDEDATCLVAAAGIELYRMKLGPNGILRE